MSTPLCECLTAFLSDLQTSMQCFLAESLASVCLYAALPIRLQSPLQSSIAQPQTLPPAAPLPQPVSASFCFRTDMRICVIWTVGCISHFPPCLPKQHWLSVVPSTIPPIPPLPYLLSLSVYASEKHDKRHIKKKKKTPKLSILVARHLTDAPSNTPNEYTPLQLQGPCFWEHGGITFIILSIRRQVSLSNWGVKTAFCFQGQVGWNAPPSLQLITVLHGLCYFIICLKK